MALSAKRLDELRGLKDRAAQLTAKGKLDKALAALDEALSISPHDTALHQKRAELFARLGRTRDAIRAYQHVVGAWADEGHLLRAIAICKIILQLDARHTETQRALAELYARQRGTGRTATLPPAMGSELGRKRPDSAELPTPVAAPGASPVAAADEVIIEALEELDIALEAVEVDAPSSPQIPLFSELGPAAFTAVLEEVELASFEPGERVVREGERDGRMFAIVQGSAKVKRGSRTVAELTEGDFFGEMALLTDAPRLASVEAAGELVVLIFTREKMEQVTAAHPSVQQALERFYRERLLANLVRSSPLFSPLSDAAREELAASFKPRSYRAGEVILQEGKAPDAFYLLLRGQCTVTDEAAGRPRALPPLGEGEVFGELSLIRGKPVSATVRAETEVTVLRLGQAAFNAQVLGNPGVAKALRTLGAQRLARSAALARVNV